MTNREIYDLTKDEVFELLWAYSTYIYNHGEPWGADKQPIGVREFFDWGVWGGK